MFVMLDMELYSVFFLTKMLLLQLLKFCNWHQQTEFTIQILKLLH